MLAIATTSKRDARRCHSDHHGRRSKRRFIARRCRAEQATCARASVAITTAQRARAFAARGHVDFQPLRRKSIDAALHVRRIDVLTIAEKTAGRLLTRDLAAALNVGVTLQIAIHIDVRRASAAAATITMLGAIVRNDFAASATVLRTAGFRIRHAIAIGMFHLTISNERLFAFVVTTLDTVEFGGITLRNTADATGSRTVLRRRESTSAFTCSDELQRRTISRAAAFDLYFATEAVFVEVEFAAFRGRRVRGRRSRSEHQGGQSKQRQSDLGEVLHGFSFRGCKPKIPAIDDFGRLRATAFDEPMA